MNEFKESLKIKIEREKSGKIIITEPLKNLLIDFMNGKIKKSKLMEMTGIGDEETIERYVEKIVGDNPEKLRPLYDKYLEGTRENFGGYEFRAEAIEMLRRDYSQSYMANLIGVNRKSFSNKINNLQKENDGNVLGELLKRHAERKMKRQEISDEEIVAINIALDEYEEQYPVGLARYGKRRTIEARKEDLERVISTVENMLKEGMTLKEISDRKIISEGMYRKYKTEYENLTKILDGDGKEEKGQ